MTNLCKKCFLKGVCESFIDPHQVSKLISDLIRVQFKHVLDPKNSVRSHLMLTEQKTGKENKVVLSKGRQKSDRGVC